MRVRWRHRGEALGEQRGLLRQPQRCRLSWAWAWAPPYHAFCPFCQDSIGIKRKKYICAPWMLFWSSLHLDLRKRFKPSMLSIEQKKSYHRVNANIFEQPSIRRRERKAMTYLSTGMWKSLAQTAEGRRLFFRSNMAEHKYFILICTAHLAGMRTVYMLQHDDSRADRWGIPTLTSTNTARALFVLWQPLSLDHWALFGWIFVWSFLFIRP